MSVEVPVEAGQFEEENNYEDERFYIAEENHRSGNTGTSAFVRFINTTDRDVDIVWINYSGKYIRYRKLNKDNFLDVNTYNSHPWVAFDYHTKDRLHIEKEFVFFPKTLREYFKVHPDRVFPIDKARIPAYITVPMYSLKYSALLAVRNTLKSCKEAEVLELPRVLIDDLKRVIKLRNNLLYTFNSSS
ncbi:protein Vhl [Diabrotica undecimpunctata]|uniref:protein Vhl n=1 Tax=Diabrotica undecimpunctata TaxID=50387 RepID=UPI003B633876